VNILKKLKVNTEGCIGCGACVGLDPEHFTFNDDNLSTIKSEENINPELAQTVVEVCPVGVISYEEDDSITKENESEQKEKVCNCEEHNNEDSECKCNCKESDNEDSECECNCKENDNEDCESDCECQKCHCKEDVTKDN